MKCYMCGSQLSPTDSICSVCGAKVLETPISNASENKKVDFPILNNNNQNNEVNYNSNVSTNGFQMDDFSHNKNKKISSINSNFFDKQDFNAEDFFSSPKVSIGYNKSNVQNVSKNSFSNQNYVQPSINYNNQSSKNEYKEKKTFKINWKLVVVFLAFLIIAGVGFFSFDYFQKIQEKRKSLEQEEIRKEVEDSIIDYEKQREEKAQQMKENIDLASENVLYDGSLLFTYENNNNVVSAVEFIISFYDDNDELLGSVKEYAYPAPYTKFLIKINKYNIVDGYKRYEVDIKVNDYELIPVEIDTNKFVINDTGEAISVSYIDENDDIDHLELCILYYSNESIVGAECISNNDVSAGNIAKFDFEYYYANKYEGLLFDTYRFAVSAYNKVKNDS
ncbi:MAG: hypothetical protein ACI4XM_01550 [Candidatus Coprovivens sp.]